jgi:hypothetical protein
MLNRQTEQISSVIDADQPQMYQPNREASAMKMHEQGMTRKDDALFPRPHNQSHKAENQVQ